MHTSFGKTRDGREARLYTLYNQSGMKACVTDYGATLVRVIVPDKEGTPRDVVLGHDDVRGYEEGSGYFGAVIGRSGNRIANAAFTLNDTTYHLAANENGNSLHSNPDGYDSRIWETTSESEQSVTFALLSPDMDQGFPGTLHIAVTYALDDDGELSLHYEGTCDQDTIVNMTNHSYFNLNGCDSDTDITDHELCLNCRFYTPVANKASIPTGEIASVSGTPMDFTKLKRVGDEIDADFAQLLMTGGYDHNFVIDRDAPGMAPAAYVVSRLSGIEMEVATESVGVQFYSGNFVDHADGKDGHVYQKRSGLCLETQYFPNAVNTPAFAQPFLPAGRAYDTTTTYTFRTVR